MNKIYLVPTDILFTDSPSTCDSACLCSRCGKIIHAGQNIVRGWTQEKPQREFRYHARCLGFQSRDELACDCFDDADDDDDFEAALDECGLQRDGFCDLAGTEFCDWECAIGAS